MDASDEYKEVKMLNLARAANPISIATYKHHALTEISRWAAKDRHARLCGNDGRVHVFVFRQEVGTGHWYSLCAYLCSGYERCGMDGTRCQNP